MIELAYAIVIIAFLLLGMFFTFVSATGVIRLPDVFSRAHTVSQTDTLGAGFALMAVALAMGVQADTVKILLLLFFIFITNPTAGHAIARAAHEKGYEPWRPDDAEGTGSGGDTK